MAIHFLRKVDADGLFVEDVFHDDADGPIPAGLVATPAPEGFVRPKWNGTVWVEGGVKPATVPPVYTCTPWQIRKALNALGLRQAVEASIAASVDQALKDGWEYATEFRSDDPFVISMGTSLGKSEAETADLIQAAATL